jgi:hypothetical protein
MRATWVSIRQVKRLRKSALMAAQEVGRGRTLAFGGQTWLWARASEEARSAYHKFWRQALFWVGNGYVPTD